MTDLRERVAKALSQGDYEMWAEKVERVQALIRAERAQVWEEAAGISDTEEELDGPMPPAIAHEGFERGWDGVMRAAVRATKKSISQRIRARAEEERRG